MPLQRWGQMDSRPHGTRKRRFVAPGHSAPKSKNPSAPLKTGLILLTNNILKQCHRMQLLYFLHHVEISESAMTMQLAIEDCVIRFSLNRVDSYPNMKIGSSNYNGEPAGSLARFAGQYLSLCRGRFLYPNSPVQFCHFQRRNPGLDDQGAARLESERWDSW